LPCLIKGKRVKIELTDSTLKLIGDVRIVLKDGRIELHKAIPITKNVNINEYNKVYMVLSLDNFITTDNGIYGTSIGEYILSYSNDRSEKNLIKLKQYINSSINSFINNECPTHVVLRNMNKSFLIN